MIDYQTIWYYPTFRWAMPNSTVRTKVLLTRSPLSRLGRDHGLTQTLHRLTRKSIRDSPCVVCKSPWVLSETRPIDLHALSTPPAFILDQDQILKNNHQRITNPLRIYEFANSYFIRYSLMEILGQL